MSAVEKIQKELLQDKSLWSVYRKSLSYSETTFDKWCKIFSCVILLAISIIFISSKDNLFPFAVEAVKNWLDMGFLYSITILGFLVAGFTIFATMTKVEIFIALAEIEHKTEKVSHIRFIFYNFLRVFINHIILLMVVVSISILKSTDHIYLNLIDDITLKIEIKRIAVFVVLPTVGCLLIGAVLQLKTFVWNLYQSVIMAIAGAIVLFEKEKQDAEKPA